MNKSEFVNRIYSEKYVSKVISKVKLLGYDSNVSAYDIILIRLFGERRKQEITLLNHYQAQPLLLVSQR